MFACKGKSSSASPRSMPTVDERAKRRRTTKTILTQNSGFENQYLRGCDIERCHDLARRVVALRSGGPVLRTNDPRLSATGCSSADMPPMPPPAHDVRSTPVVGTKRHEQFRHCDCRAPLLRRQPPVQMPLVLLPENDLEFLARADRRMRNARYADGAKMRSDIAAEEAIRSEQGD